MNYPTTNHTRARDGVSGPWCGAGITALLLASLLSLTACSNTESAPNAEQVVAAHQTAAVLHELSGIKLVNMEGAWIADVVFDTEVTRFSWREGSPAKATFVKKFSRDTADANQVGTPVLTIVPYANVERTTVSVDSDWARKHPFDQGQRAALLKATELISPATEIYLVDKAEREKAKAGTGAW